MEEETIQEKARRMGYVIHFERESRYLTPLRSRALNACGQAYGGLRTKDTSEVTCRKCRYLLFG